MDWKTLPLLEVKGRGIGKHCKILSLIEVKIEGSKTLQNIVVERGQKLRIEGIKNIANYFR